MGNLSFLGILEVIMDWPEGKGESIQFAEVKVVQLALDVAEWER